MTNNEYIEIANLITQTDWDEKESIRVGKYCVSQFQGTAFDSNYACYKVQWALDHCDFKAFEEVNPNAIVAKITNQTEQTILGLLSEMQLPVPKVEAVLQSRKRKIMVFMELLAGSELYENPDHNVWINAVTELAKIHLRFWISNAAKRSNKTNIPSSRITQEKIGQALAKVAHNKEWKAYMTMACERISFAPQTLIHGDMFPTNVLVNQESVSFIDWADAGIFAYMMDLGRLTVVIDQNTLLPMCPCPEKVIMAYYTEMEHVLNMSYEDYEKDIRIAQFVELMVLYTPPQCYGYTDKLNQTIEKAINKIVLAHLKT